MNITTTSKGKITRREVNYSEWYNDVIREADMVDSSPTRGCLIIKPWAMSIWDSLKTRLDAQIKAHGCDNAYFPLLIPQSFFTKEAEHIKGFAKECAVVTHSKLTTGKSTGNSVILVPDPASKLEEALIVRPTSETVIWSSFGKWISSYRDLPMKLNQWCNVFRWEMRTRPFLRTSEFLWQEGHSAHATKECAVNTTKHMLQVYTDVCRDVLALPVVQGLKSPMERFAGAYDTYTIEGLMQNGWALQCGTSHFLGQNFGKAFDVYFQNDKSSIDIAERELVWGTSFGVSTRLIGAMIMSHSDDKGLVCPPAVAPVQVVIVPLYDFNKDTSPEGLAETQRINKGIDEFISDITCHLSANDIRYKKDYSEARPGAKYYHWERKGVPLRISIGAREVVSRTIDCVVRFDSSVVKLSTDSLNTTTTLTTSTSTSTSVSPFTELLNSIHENMYTNAVTRMQERTHYVSTYDELKTLLLTKPGSKTSGMKHKCKNMNKHGNSMDINSTNATSTSTATSATIISEDIGLTAVETTLGTNTTIDIDAHNDHIDSASYSNQHGFYIVPWKCNEENELFIKEELKLSIRCYPSALNGNSTNTNCRDNNGIHFPNVSVLTKDCKCFYSGLPATHLAMFARAY